MKTADYWDLGLCLCLLLSILCRGLCLRGRCRVLLLSWRLPRRFYCRRWLSRLSTWWNSLALIRRMLCCLSCRTSRWNARRSHQLLLLLLMALIVILGKTCAVWLNLCRRRDLRSSWYSFMRSRNNLTDWISSRTDRVRTSGSNLLRRCKFAHVLWICCCCTSWGEKHTLAVMRLMLLLLLWSSISKVKVSCLRSTERWSDTWSRV